MRKLFIAKTIARLTATTKKFNFHIDIRLEFVYNFFFHRERVWITEQSNIHLKASSGLSVSKDVGFRRVR